VRILDDADEEALTDACCDRLVPARDATITLLALSTGMRAYDIASLKTQDIDWRTSTLTVLQQKTRNPLTVPLLSAVAEALAEYILAERPDTEFDNVFVSANAPHLPYTTNASSGRSWTMWGRIVCLHRATPTGSSEGVVASF